VTAPEERLRELGLDLPEVVTPAANYVGAVRTGNLVFLAGHGPVRDGKNAYVGKLGRDLDIEEGQKAAELVALNLLATLKHEIGDLARVKRVVKLLVLVNSTSEFGDQPRVANGASDLLVAVFGEERGKHARSAVGAVSLPFGIAVEIEAIFELDEQA
jgi:enamine deaminase RidA (YjgF/YER057c/UK114 family)